jgi:hypothetical protein
VKNIITLAVFGMLVYLTISVHKLNSEVFRDSSIMIPMVGKLK